MDRRTALTIDAEHAALEVDSWEQVIAFGIGLEALLIREGYKAQLHCDKDYPMCICQVLLEVDSIGSYIQVWYCNKSSSMRDEPSSYSVSGSSDVDFGRWVSNVVGIESLLIAIPALISELIEGSQKVRARRECRLCHYGAEFYPHPDSGGYCGMGLVGDGNCSHYVGPALVDSEE